MDIGNGPQLPTDKEFQLFQQLIQDKLGIYLPDQKKALLSNRLWKRLPLYNMKSFGEYYHYLKSSDGHTELNKALELITTNETYFFREQKHFDYLRDDILSRLRGNDTFRVWCAAASTGEEPYSIAMLLKDRCLSEWELLCSDVNASVIAQAKTGIYPDSRTQNISESYMRRFCRKGIGSQEGYLRVVAELRKSIDFFTLNLNQQFPDIGKFDVVFLRNVLIYFENDTKEQVINRIVNTLKPGGVLFVGHSESLHGLSTHLKAIKPAIYRLG